MKKIIVKEANLRKALEEAFHDTKDFEWSGWRLPVFLSEDGISVGDWLSNNSYQPGAIEIASVERWSLSEHWSDYEGNNDDEDSIAVAIDELVEKKIEQLQEAAALKDINLVIQ